MNETKEVALTTIDNPFDPFTQFDEWFSFDCDKGYNTCGYLARILFSRIKDYMTENEKMKATEDAIDEIVAVNITGLYVKKFKK